jgi:hypothetical protein
MANTRKTRTNTDAVLKEVAQAAGPPLGRLLLNREIKRFLNIEFASTKTRRVDLLAEDAEGALHHLEFQASNDQKMPWRELEYYVLIYEQTGIIPRQIVIYVGRGTMRMPVRIEHPTLKFEYVLLDIRTIDARPFIESDEIEMNIIGILCRDGATVANLRHVMTNMGRLKGQARKDALEKLAALAGLRMQPNEFFKEVIEMNLQAELKENLIFRSYYNDGQAALLQTQLQTKFGALPEWVLVRLKSAKTKELEKFGVRLLNAARLEDVFTVTSNGATKKKSLAKGNTQ